MNSKIQKLRETRNEGGFTLVELLIVIVVLGILAGITVFGVATFKDNANTAACTTSAKAVQVAAQAYNAATGALPPAGVVDASHVLVTSKYISDPGSKVTVTLDGTGKATCVSK